MRNDINVLVLNFNNDINILYNIYIVFCFFFFLTLVRSRGGISFKMIVYIELYIGKYKLSFSFNFVDTISIGF